MSAYLWIKLVHIVSATILFGTGLGTAFFMLRAHLSRNEDAMRVTVQTVVVADWIFTTPAVLIQLLSGLWLAKHLHIAFDSPWFVTVIALYVFIGLCWIPVVWIQIRIRALIAAGAVRSDYSVLMKIWIALGVAAFTSVLALFFLMVSRLGAYN